MSILPPALFMEDSTKYLLFFVVILAIVAIARAARGGNAAASYQTQPGGEPVEDPSAAGDPSDEADADADMDEPAEPEDALHPEMRYGDILLKSLYFDSFDILKGPEDPRSFFGELTLECVNVKDGYKFQQSYVVGTADGLAKTFASEKFAIMRLPLFFAVEKYDLELIRETIMAEITGEGHSMEPLGAKDGALQKMMGSGE